jgi:hypothetical protein
MKRPDVKIKTEEGQSSVSFKTTKKLNKNLIEDRELVAKNLLAYKRAEKEEFLP